MAKKGGRKGGGMSSAARSAAAKKGWETRRRGGGAKATAPSKPKAPPKTTTARGRARTAETRARAAVKAGGGTKAARSLLTAQRARDYYKATGTGTKRSKTRSYAAPASNIRRTGGLPRPATGNGIRRTTGPRRAPMATKQNAIRTYEPKTPGGQMAKGLRRIDRAVRGVESNIKRIKGVKKQAGDIMDRIARSSARNIADSSRKDVIGDVARIMMRSEPGSLQRAARDVIRRRAGRAAAAAARGSKPAAKAMGIYDTQLAPVLPGKPGKKSGNTIKPGPRNANPPKKKTRKPRTPKPPGTPKPKRKRK